MFDDVLHAPPPRFTDDQAAGLAAEHFGFEGSARSLGSERDQTFLVEGADGSGILKISNAVERVDRLDMEALAAWYAKEGDPDLPIALPWAVPGADPGDGPAGYRSKLETDGRTHYLRMYDRMPGTASVDDSQLSYAAVRNWGRVAGRLSRAMRGFHHPAAERVMLWDVQHALLYRGLLPALEAGPRASISRVLDRYEEVVTPVWRYLRTQVLHGDLCSDNVLVDEDGIVTGIIDFGDMSLSATVIDVVGAVESFVNGRSGEDHWRTIRVGLDGFQEVVPLEPEELAIIGELIAARSAGNLAISAWRAKTHPEIAEFTIRQSQDALAVVEKFLEVGFDEARRRISGAARVEDLIERRRGVLGSALVPLDYDRPVHVVRGQGVWLFDEKGRRYLDCYNNVPVVGHAHPRVIGAITRQARMLNTNMRYLHPTVVELAERLIALTPNELDTVMFVNTGSEANDLAWRMSVVASGNRGGLCTEHAYHGVTDAIAAVSPENWSNARKPDHVETFAPPDAYRGLHLGPGGFADAVERLQVNGHGLAATFLDGVLLSNGVLDLGPALAQELRHMTREAGGYWVADEVQGGHARTGVMWSFERLGIVPDFVTLGKPMGNGHPVAAVITRSDIVDRFAEATDWFSTFAGNPVSSAAALAVLDVIADEGIPARAAELGGSVREGLREVASRYPQAGDVRGMGMVNTIELVVDPGTKAPDAALAHRVVNVARERGVLIGTAGKHDNCLKIRPPLAFSAAEVPLLVETIDASLAEAVSGGNRR